ncbi:Serine/threonine protein phosphatase [Candidatus Burkholderia verschuerenii]|uniref:Serine/threonine protein phosphatase n=1 Tax=Candidatus Burkholderia verschuerenii TaxID=242163 RepID=A0A0L0M5J2_9BURK|nr:Serine/threonine protein phosphatase [Candidatus Burkholderia verschuerenii]
MLGAQDIHAEGADVTVNLGDIVSGALHPSETADLLMTIALPTIRGNHERQLLTQPRADQGLSDRWALDHLSADQLAWIEALPVTLDLQDNVLLVHGTPDSDLDYFLETVDENGLRAATPEEVEHRATNARTELILCGHTHLQRSMKLRDGDV